MSVGDTRERLTKVVGFLFLVFCSIYKCDAAKQGFHEMSSRRTVVCAIFYNGSYRDFIMGETWRGK